jgi:hypothetical protein
VPTRPRLVALASDDLAHRSDDLGVGGQGQLVAHPPSGQLAPDATG